MDDFEAELARRLRVPIGGDGVDPADNIAMCVERRIEMRRRMATLAVAVGGVAIMVAILFSVRISEDALPVMQVGTAASIALRLPIVITAALLTLAVGTIAVVLMRTAR